MEEPKPKNIRAVGLGIIAASMLGMIANGLFIIIVNYAGGVESFLGPNSATLQPGFYNYWNNIYKLAIMISLYSLFFLIGGILLIKFNRWSRIILTSVAVLFSITITFMFINLVTISWQEFLHPFDIPVLVSTAIILITKSVLLIIFINKKQIRSHFL
jgi:hypothetical protein